ncbi:TatD family [Gongronella butleri]|nr:TatD family [Gongronella butleri]
MCQHRDSDTATHANVSSPAGDDPLTQALHGQLLDDSFDTALYATLCDGHCHPHDDRDQLDAIGVLQTGRVTLMGVRQDDWPVVEKLHTTNPQKCVPCFGIHPWFVYRLQLPDCEAEDGKQHYEHVLTSRDDDEKCHLITQLKPPIPFSSWYTELRAILERHPHALLGEVGLDRAARLLPGGAIEWHGVAPTQVSCTIEHQYSVLQQQLLLAIELDRAVSVHCVQSQGHILQLLSWVKQHRPPQPLRVCIHSFGGKPQTIQQWLHVKSCTVYISFSMAINARLGWPKLCQLIQAVPDDRLLIESDVNSPEGLDKAVAHMAILVARAKEWTVERAVTQTNANWHAFTQWQEN